MVKHVVFFKFKDKKDIELAKNSLLYMKGKIEELIDLEVGVDFLGSERSYDLVLITTHTDKGALEYYQNHEIHQPVKRLMEQIRLSSVSVDFEVE